MGAVRGIGVVLCGIALVASPAVGATSGGSVDHVVDGDTIAIDVDGDGRSAVHVRNAGIQAMERGQCGADLATATMQQLAGSGRVVLQATSLSSASTDSGGRVRPLRYVSTPAGTDVQLELLRRGLVLAYPFGGEIARQDQYHAAAQVAAHQGVGLYSKQLCAPGPAADARLRMWVNWDADGPDKENINGEYVRVLNEGPTAVDLSGWWVRSPTPKTFTFPAGTSVPAGGTVTVHSGSGSNSGSHFYWGGTSTRFYNPSPSGVHAFSAYLFDPDGDLRAWSMYPCTVGCGEPFSEGANLRWTATYDPPGDESRNPNAETLQALNVGSDRIDLSYRVVTMNGYVLELPGGSFVDPGETLVVHMGRGTPSRLHAYWGHDRALLPNYGGAAMLRSNDGVAIACVQWGNGGPEVYRCTSGLLPGMSVLPTAPPPSQVTSQTGPRRPTVSLSVQRKTRVRIAVAPGLPGSANYRVIIQRRSGKAGKWRTYRVVRTAGTSERRIVNVPRGRYRAVVPAQYGMARAVSGRRFVAR